MRYAVLNLNRATVGGAATLTTKATEDEAKQLAEQLAAVYRACLTTKQYFAITVVDTYTGELVGSIVDAPPAVNWD